MISRTRLFDILEPAKPGDPASRLFDIGLVTLIALNIAALFAESVKPIYAMAPKGFRGFEVFSLAVFTLEYAARLWSCTASPEHSRPIAGRLHFAMRPLVVLDLLVILPVFFPFLGVDLRFMRIIRLLRAFRAFKLARYSVALQTGLRVLSTKKDDLVVAFSVLLLLLVLSASLIYVAEHRAQPEQFVDIPTALWWCLSTATKLGLSDLAPVTVSGKALTAVMSLLGIAVITLPTAIISSGFIQEVRKDKLALCPHCGKQL